MSEEQPAVTTRPSQVTMTKMMAEIDAQGKRSARKWLLTLLVPLLIGAVILALMSFAVYKRLAEIGELDRQIADKKKEVEAQKQIIQKKNETIEEKDAAKLELTTGINNALENIKDPEAKKQFIETVTLNPTVAASTPRVFIHYYDKDQKGKASQLGGTIKRLGYIVPDTQKVTVAVSNPEVRYFRPEDQSAADGVAASLSGQGLSNVKVRQMNMRQAKPGLIEVWLPPQPGSSSSPTPARPEDRRVIQDYVPQPQPRPTTQGDNRRPRPPKPSNSPN